jgi:hypothetical protein
MNPMQAWWHHRQGLDGSYNPSTAAQVLERSGWARSVGGAAPYVSMFARAGIRREEADRAAAGLEIHELPAARGCTYVVPARDFALALKVGQPFNDAPMRVAMSVGVTAQEVDKLCDAVLAALAKGVMSPDEIRAATGNASRSLGEAGKKKGVTTTLPLALGRLQAFGEIRRVPVNGRLDQQRYKYALWRPNPLSRYKASLEESYAQLAHRYFFWAGPATLAEFQEFAGLGVKTGKAAVAGLRLVPAEKSGDRLLLEECLDDFHKFKAPSKPQYALVSSLDSIQVRLGSDLPSHPILDRGSRIGSWEYDVDTQSIAWMTDDGVNDRALVAAVRRMEEFVRNDLGDARSFSLDSPKSRASRIAEIRKVSI